jgi:hypothetical protein
MAPERADVRSGNGVDGNGVARSARSLLARIIDYAGLFPPADLPMPAAVYNYAHYLTLPFSWMLGRFVVPAARLEEFVREAAPLLPPQGSSSVWGACLLSADPERDIRRIEELQRDHPGVRFESIELKANSAVEIAAAVKVIPGSIRLHCEIPLAGEFESLLAPMAQWGVRAKIRCGGITPGTFPAADRVAAFLRECHAAGVSFKATAGLHHPVRGSYPLTYAPGSPTEVMHGFLNLFLAAAWVRHGMPPDVTESLLEERSAAAFRFQDDGVEWREHQLSTAEILAARRDFALSFGSCSFSEPVADLRILNLIS